MCLGGKFLSEKILIKGGRELRGEVHIGGAKNAVLKLMAAALLLDGAVKFIMSLN